VALAVAVALAAVAAFAVVANPLTDTQYFVH
jgi:hypothetical protein